jgi:hypothetical protein
MITGIQNRNLLDFLQKIRQVATRQPMNQKIHFKNQERITDKTAATKNVILIKKAIYVTNIKQR